MLRLINIFLKLTQYIIQNWGYLFSYWNTIAPNYHCLCNFLNLILFTGQAMKIIEFFKINNNCNGNHQSQLYPTIILSMKQMSIKCMKIHKMMQNETNYKGVIHHIYIYVDFLYFGALVLWCSGIEWHQWQKQKQ